MITSKGLMSLYRATTEVKEELVERLGKDEIFQIIHTTLVWLIKVMKLIRIQLLALLVVSLLESLVHRLSQVIEAAI